MFIRGLIWLITMSIIPTVSPTFRNKTTIEELFTQAFVDFIMSVTEPTFELGAIICFRRKAMEIVLEMGGAGLTGIDSSKRIDKLADGVFLGCARSLNGIVGPDRVQQGPGVST